MSDIANTPLAKPQARSVFFHIAQPLPEVPLPTDIFLGQGGRIGTALLARLLFTIFEANGCPVVSYWQAFELPRALVCLEIGSKKFPLREAITALERTSLHHFVTIAEYDPREDFHRVHYPALGAFTFPTSELEAELELMKKVVGGIA